MVLSEEDKAWIEGRLKAMETKLLAAFPQWAVTMGKRRMELLSAEERQALAAKAGKRRLKTMSKAERKAVAQKAAAARWAKKAE